MKGSFIGKESPVAASHISKEKKGGEGKREGNKSFESP